MSQLLEDLAGWIEEHPDVLTPTAQAVAYQLAAHANSGGITKYLTVTVLGEKVGVKDNRTVKKAITALTDAGLVTVYHQPGHPETYRWQVPGRGEKDEGFDPAFIQMYYQVIGHMYCQVLEDLYKQLGDGETE